VYVYKLVAQTAAVHPRQLGGAAPAAVEV